MPYLGRAPGVGNTVTGNLKVSGTISAESINDKLALNGSDNSSPQANANDQILLEAGTLTDASHASVVPTMAASDNLLLEDVTPSFVGSQTILGENVTSLPFANINTGTSTSGQLLTSGGVGVAPSFTTVSGGAWEFVSKTSVPHDNSGDITITGLTAYHTYKIFLWSVSNTSTSGTTDMQISNDGGGSWITSSTYRFTMIYSHTNGSGISGDYSNGTNLGWKLFEAGTETGDFPQSSEITLFRGRYDDANRSDNRPHMIHHGFRTSNSGGYGYQFHTAGWESTQSESDSANAVKFLKNGGGSLQHGHIIICGLKES